MYLPWVAMQLLRIFVLLRSLVIWRFVIDVFKYLVACAGKVTPLRIIGGRSNEEGRVSIAGPHGDNFIFANPYRDIFTSVFAFAW